MADIHSIRYYAREIEANLMAALMLENAEGAETLSARVANDVHKLSRESDALQTAAINARIDACEAEEPDDPDLCTGAKQTIQRHLHAGECISPWQWIDALRPDEERA